VIEADKALIRSLGLEPVPVVPGKTVRVSILPLKLARIDGVPPRIIVPVLHYINADPSSGKYLEKDDESAVSIEWKIRYLCLRQPEISRIRGFPDEDQAAYDIDLALSPDTISGYGYHISRVRRRPRWQLSGQLAQEVNREAGKLGEEFISKLDGVPGVMIFDDFRNANRVNAGVTTPENNLKINSFQTPNEKD
jgi:hypothetical protein